MTSKCAVRHNGLQFFISHLARWLRTRRLSESTFRPSGTTKFGKNTKGSRLFYLFAHLHLLSSDSFSSLIFFLLLVSSLLFSSRLVSSLLFSSLILPTSAFSPVHIVGNLTSKLPSQNQYTSVSTNVIRCKPMETNIYIYIKISTCIYQCKSM